MVEKEIAGLVDSQEQPEPVPEPESEPEHEPDEEEEPDYDAEELNPPSENTNESEISGANTELQSAVENSKKANDNEQQLSDIFDFLHKKLADSGISGTKKDTRQQSRFDDSESPAAEPTISYPVGDLPPPPPDGSDQFEQVEEEQAKGEIETIFTGLQLKLKTGGIVTSLEQASVLELTMESGEDLHSFPRISPLPSPPPIEPLANHTDGGTMNHLVPARRSLLPTERANRG